MLFYDRESELSSLNNMLEQSRTESQIVGKRLCQIIR